MHTKEYVPATSRGTVLITDSAPSVREVLGRMLERNAYTARSAASGRDVLALVQQAPGDLCCVFLGVSMAPIDGITLATIIEHLAPYLPLVLMSGYPAWMLADRLQFVPRVHFLAKPFTLAQLNALMTRVQASGATRTVADTTMCA